jgi:hypothetical protein
MCPPELVGALIRLSVGPPHGNADTEKDVSV